MNKKLRNLILLKFFSTKTKLILSLVFVVIIAIVLGRNYLQFVNADNGLWPEDFTTTVKKDVNNTNAKWITGGVSASLWGKEWADMGLTNNSYENISNLVATSSSEPIIKVGSNNIPYVIWIESTGASDIFFTKWTTFSDDSVCDGGINQCWTNMAGTIAGPENISQTATSCFGAKLVLDSANNPFIVWSEQTGGTVARFTKWTPSANAWTKMDGTAEPTFYEDVPLAQGFFPDIALDSNDYPYIVAETGSKLNFSRWNGSQWVTMDNNPDYEFLSTTIGLKPIIKISRSSVPDYNNNPNIIYAQGSDLFFIRWKKGDDGTVCGFGNTACWTNFAGDAIGEENISNTGLVAVNVFQMEINMSVNPNTPYVVWENSVAGTREIYFSKGTLGAGPGACGMGIDDCWTKMNGTTAPSYDNVSNTAGFNSLNPQLKLDSAKNPYIVWQDNSPGNNDIFFTKWTPSASAWTKMSGAVLPTSYDNLSLNAGNSQNPVLQINPVTNNAYILWADARIYLSKGIPGTGWMNLQGVLGNYDDLSLTAPSSALTMDIGANNNLYASWVQTVGVTSDMLFTKIMPVYQTPGILQSVNINPGTDFIVNAKILAVQTLNGQTINYFLSNDSGTTWESASNNTLHNFSAQGSDLRWKAELQGTATVTPVINSLDILYVTKKLSCSLNPQAVAVGSAIDINATTSFLATNVWATVEKAGVVLNNNVIMNNIGGNDYLGSYQTAASNVGQNNVAVFATDSASGETYVCNPSNGENWQKMTVSDIPWSPRTYHEAVDFNGQMYLLGGLSDSFLSEVWRSSDGNQWTKIIDAPWSGRGLFNALVFNNKIWVMGGRSYIYTNVPTNYSDVWSSSNGQNWLVASKELPLGPGGYRDRVNFGATVYDNKIWIAGGIVHGVNTNDVWYNDDPANNDWTLATAAAPWSARQNFQMITYNNEMWVMGGNGPLNDVWHSSDGISWTQATAIADWPGRVNFQAAVFDEDGAGPEPEKMWVMGGANAIVFGRTTYNEVWSSEDGVDWTLRSNPLWPEYYDLNSAPSSWDIWSARHGFSVVKHNNGSGDKLYLLGGYEYRNGSQNDVWVSANGFNWDIIGNNYEAPFSPRFATRIINFKPVAGTEQLWLVGGAVRSIGSTNDIWSSSDGRSWIKRVDNGVSAWPKRFGQGLLSLNNKLWILGGCANDQPATLNTQPSPFSNCMGKCINGATPGAYCNVNTDCGAAPAYCKFQALNDVWNSDDGLSWTPIANPAPWVGRAGATYVTFNNKMYIIGGWLRSRCSGGDVPGSMCYSTTQCTGGGICSGICLSGSLAGQACSNNTNCGGNKCSNYTNGYYNDVISSSDGVNWTQEIADAPWSLRYNANAISFNDGYGEKLYYMGGGYLAGAINNYFNDIWWTADGSHWYNTFCQSGFKAGFACVLDADCGSGVNCLAKTAEWPARQTFGLQEYDNKLWVFSGQVLGDVPGPGTGLLPALWTKDAWWSINGSTWTKATDIAQFPGRDYFTSAVFDNRLFLTGGDTNWGTMNDVWASTYNYDNMTFLVSEAGSNSSTPLTVGDFNCEANGPTSMLWQFTDTADNEQGYRLYEPTVNGAVGDLILQVLGENLSQINENNLQINQQYSRYVVAFNDTGESTGSEIKKCFTNAATPLQLEKVSQTDNSVTLKINPGDNNPEYTKYAIYEAVNNKYVQADGTFSDTEVWQTYNEWGGDQGLEIVGGQSLIQAQYEISLDLSQSYSFSVKAKNGDNIETPFSLALNLGAPLPPPPPAGSQVQIIASKSVGISIAQNNNILLSLSPVRGVAAATNSGEKNSNFLIILQQVALVLFLSLILAAILLGLGLKNTLKHLGQNKAWTEKSKLLWLALIKEPAHIFEKYLKIGEHGGYNISFASYKKIHLSNQKHFYRVIGLGILDLFILGILLINFNHSGIAQVEYNQNNQPVAVGEKLNYKIEYSNAGSQDAQDVIINDTLDPNLNYVAGSGQINSGTGETGIGVTANGQTISFNLGQIKAGDSGYVLLNAQVMVNSEGSVISNQAKFDGSNFATVMTNFTYNQVKTTPILPICGNGLLEAGESCDKTSCGINKQCVNCQCQAIVPVLCGNGVIDSGEQCDQSSCAVNQICTNCQCQEIPQINTNTNTNQPPSPPISPTPPIPPTSPIPPTPPTPQTEKSVLQNPILEFLRVNIWDNKQVEKTSQNIITPLLLTIALLNLISAVPLLLLHILPFLHLLFTEPFLWLFKKRREKWGVVYDALSKIPVDLAVVRLYAKADNRLIQTRVTDRDGRYLILVKEPGQYYLSVVKPGFLYPTRYLAQDKEDLKYLDLYHGEELTVSAKQTSITPNIPLDPVEKKLLAEKQVIRTYLLKNIRLIVSYVGIILALLIVLLYPTIITIGALIGHVLLFALFRRLSVPAKPKSWGIVYDESNKEPLKQAIVRIFDIKFNKLLETQVTDGKGRYAFLVGQNDYQLLSEKEGYEKKEVKPVDLIQQEQIINLDIGLKKNI